MSSEISAWRDEFRQALERMELLIGGLSEDQANWSPRSGQWSVNECLDHLNTSSSEYFQFMEPAIERARTQGLEGEPPYLKGPLIGRWLASFMAKGSSKKVEAPAAFLPDPSGLHLAKVSKDYRGFIAHWVEICEKAEGLALGRIRFRTPVSSLLRLSLNQAFEIHTLHYHRHLDQAERVKAQLP